MKPNWKNAPNWANWLAMDGDGEWNWFENKPVLANKDGDCIYWLIGWPGQSESADCAFDDADKSLEQRPSLR